MLKNVFPFLSEVARKPGTNYCAGQRQMLERLLPYLAQTSSFTSWKSQVIFYFGCLIIIELHAWGKHT